jgi:hypothetical protein
MSRESVEEKRTEMTEQGKVVIETCVDELETLEQLMDTFKRPLKRVSLLKRVAHKGRKKKSEIKYA